jgi:hypothetical protein
MPTDMQTLESEMDVFDLDPQFVVIGDRPDGDIQLYESAGGTGCCTTVGPTASETCWGTCTGLTGRPCAC